MMTKKLLATWLGAFLIAAGVANAQDVTADFEKGPIELTSAGPLAFAPQGILLVGDAKAATIYAIDVGEMSKNPNEVSLEIANLDEKLAGALGIDKSEVMVNDLAVNPMTGTAYLSVSRGKGPDAAVVLIQVTGPEEFSELSLKDVSHSTATLPNAPGEDQKDRRGQPLRAFSITDISFVDGRVVVAGLSNEEFSSNLRAIQFPFELTGEGTAVEVFHGAHGRYETNAPVRTFAPISINNEPYIVAAYTCTPLVKFPLSELKEGKKLRGTTVAELGNRNNPLDMFVYEKDGAEYILMANSARGTMKISTKDIEREEGIEKPIEDKAGQTYETIDDLKGVVQLARLNTDHALVVIQNQSGMHLKTVDLP